jgi:hypothetical protein
MPALNEQFCESGGVYPPEHLCGFASAPPAQAFVIPPPALAKPPPRYMQSADMRRPEIR